MPDRRVENRSDESTVSQVSSSLRADIDLTNELSARLDKSWNEAMEQQLNIPADATPAEVLMKVLSPESTMTTASSFALFQERQQGSPVGYRAIGFGQCGLVFEKPGRDYVVKVAKIAYDDALWSDFKAHFFVFHAFERQQHAECRIPRVYSYVPKENHSWWELNGPLLAHDSLHLPAMALITERILPLPKLARQALINTYCPPALRPAASINPTNRDCLARIYLGRRRSSNTPLAPNFTLRNCNLSVDQMIDLQLPVTLYAAAMGEGLAIIHWAAQVDAYDIEFVLGSQGDATYTRDVSTVLGLTLEQVAAMKPHTDIEMMRTIDFKRRTTRMWVLDFNLCSVWEEIAGWEAPEALIAHLVTAFFENDPYYPLPMSELEVDRRLWETFRTEYLRKADQILSAPGKNERLGSLPRKFIDACTSRERDALAAGLGHGHREHKD